MLDLAISHEEELINRFRQTWMDDKYKFYYAANYRWDVELEKKTWNSHDFVSIKSIMQQDGITYTDTEVLGYIGYQIERADEYTHDLAIISFAKTDEENIVFAADLRAAIRDIFEKYNFRRLEWAVIIGNPVERVFDRMCRRYGGRIVGTYKNRVRLIDGKYYDEKLYEIEKDDYDNAIKR
ncbi:MAG: GNAT family N-acetyltransferase [Lachnospiraceae bacterium]